MTDTDIETDDRAKLLPEGDPDSFLNAGLNVVAYVRPVYHDEGVGFMIHAANGERYAIARDFASAYGFIKQNDMEVVSLH